MGTNILVVGLGALGAVFSCMLKLDGHMVSAFDRAEMVSALKDNTVQINGIWGEHRASLDMITGSASELQDKDFDLVILAVKSYDTTDALARIKNCIKPETRVILAQNGYGNYEAAAELVPKEQLVAARVIFGAETIGPAFSKVTVIADDVILGSPQHLIPLGELEQLAAQINKAGIPCRASSEVMKYIWGKIIYNSALNSLGAILELNYGKLVEQDQARAIINQVVYEIFAVLNTAGIDLFWADANTYLNDFYKNMVPSTADHHPSMLQDIQRGRRTEIDALNGAVWRLGIEYGVATPINQTITRLVKAKERMNARKTAITTGG